MGKVNLNRFSEMLSNLGQNESASMGFGSKHERTKVPVMVLVGEQMDDSVQEHANAYLSHGIHPDNKKIWGIFGSNIKSVGWKKIKKAGCQFVIFDSYDAPADILLEENISKGMLIDDVESDSRTRAIEDTALDFLVFRPPTDSFPLNFGSTLKLQEVVSTYSKHILLYLESTPDKKDLDILKEIPISGIVVNLSKIKGVKLKRLFENIQKLKPKKNSREQRPLIPGGQGIDYQTDFEEEEVED